LFDDLIGIAADNVLDGEDIALLMNYGSIIYESIFYGKDRIVSSSNFDGFWN